MMRQLWLSGVHLVPPLPPVGRRIEAGVRFLDVRRGTEWRRSIDMQALDLADPRECILGQLYDHYDIGLYMLGIDGHDAILRGFNIPLPGSPLWEKQCRALTQGWRRFLRHEETLA
jgi:hypothetical protein